MFADLTPDGIECCRRPCEVEACKVGMRDDDLTDDTSLTGDKVDYAIGQSGFTEDFHQKIVRMNGRGRRFPNRHVTHHGRSHVQV